MEHAVTATTHTLWIPQWHPPPLNQFLSKHWTVRQKLRATTRQMIWGYGRDIPKATGKRRVTMRIVLKPRQRGADPDSMWKLVLDAMVTDKLLRNDSPRWCELLPVQYERDAAWGTRIELTECDE